MGKRRTIEDTMADAYDSSVARQQGVEGEKNERAARLGGDTIEETMANVYDDIQDRDGKAEAEQSYDYGAPPTPEPEPEPWYDYDEPENVYDPPKPRPAVQGYPETLAPAVKPTPAPSPEPEPEQDIYGPYADSTAFFSELMAQAPNPTPRGGRQVGPPATPVPGRQPRNPYDLGNPCGDTPFSWAQEPAMPVSRPPRPPVVGQPLDWNNGNPWGNPYQVRPAAPRQPHLAQQPPPPVTPVMVTPMQPGLKGETGTDSGQPVMTHVSALTKQFLDLIHRFESRDNGYLAKNNDALGRYQMTRGARIDAGMIEYIDYQKGEKWLEDYGAVPWERWLGKHGIHSEAEFLNNPIAQEKAMEEYLRGYFSGIPSTRTQFGGLIIHGLGVDNTGLNEDGTRATIYPEDGNLLAAAHREGPTRVKQYLANLSDHGGDSFAALTFESVRAQFPELTDKKVQARLDQFKAIETRLRKFQGINPWKR